MSTVYPTLPRLSVRDSFDEDDLSDVDDEVFIRDGKHGSLKLDEERGVKRPLMAPRRKVKINNINNHPKLPYRALLKPFCYGLLALFILLGLIIACIYTVNLFPIPLNVLKKWMSSSEQSTIKATIVPCTSLASSVLWTRTFPKFTSEAPFRSVDVNGDKIADIIVGFSTGLDSIDASSNLCDLYFGGQKPCLGGIMALNGVNGATIWTHWTHHAIFNVNCELDITKDGINDCLITGRGGILHTVDGSTGTPVWIFEPEPSFNSGESILDIYDATFLNDVDRDDVGDVIASHTVQSGEQRLSEIIIISGKTGNIIRRVKFPRKEELFIAPRSFVHPDGETMLVLVSSTPKKSGGIYVISYSELLHGNLRLRKLYWGTGKGILLPPVFADITSDGTEDIIIAAVNATIMAFNGLTLEQIWNYTLPNSEIISIPIPGYYNDDEVPDFMVKHQIGPGYPLYYYTASTVLNGKNGTSILDKPMTDTMGGQISGLSISVDGVGNDWFLHWSSNCLDHEDSHEKYQFLESHNLLSQSRADICKLRFNTSLVTRLWALSQHVGPPGQSIYFSEDWKNVEYNNSVDPRSEADKYYSEDLNNILFNEGLPLVSERSPSVKETHRKSSNFRHRDQEKDDEESTNYYRKISSDEMKDSNLYENNNSPAKNYQIYKEEQKDLNLDRKLDGWIDPNNWRDQENEKQYEMIYENNDELPEILGLSDVREQRSKLTGSDIDSANKSENEKNQFDPSMDYTNGGRNYVKYPPTLDVETRVDSNSKVEAKKRKRPGLTGWQKKRIENEFNENIHRRKRSEKQSAKGIQRQPPTGILLPSISPSPGKTSIDLAFSTYWLPPSEVSLILLQRDIDCIKAKQDNEKGNYEKEEIISECLAERGVEYKLLQESMSRENIKIPLGQMTIYRFKLECVCPDDMLPGEECKNISLHQKWSAHLGNTGNGFFRPPLK